MLRRLSFFAFAATAFGLATASASSALPLDTLSTGASTSPYDVVSAGRFTFFTQGNSKIGRVSEDGTVTQFPSGFTSTGRITVGPEGTLWFLGHNGSTPSKTIGRMTQDGTLLSQTQASKDWGNGLTTGADGNVWVAEGEWVAKYAPNGNLIDEYFVNVGNGGFARDVTAGPDGNIWVAESTLPGASAIGRLTPNGTLTTFTGFIGPACTPNSKPVTCLSGQTGQTGGPGTGSGQGIGSGGPNVPQGQDPASVAVLSTPTASSAPFKPLATGGPVSTNPSETGGLFVGFTVSAATRLTVRVERKTTGRKKAKKCVAPTKAKRGAKPCTHYVAKGSFTVDLTAGTKGLRFTGRLNGKKLPAGSYRLVMTPAGGKPTIVALRIR